MKVYKEVINYIIETQAITQAFATEDALKEGLNVYPYNGRIRTRGI